jgi:hypothetical protein
MEREKLHDLYRELIKEEQVVSFKTKMMKLQHVLANMFESKAQKVTDQQVSDQVIANQIAHMQDMNKKSLSIVKFKPDAKPGQSDGQQGKKFAGKNFLDQVHIGK